MSHTPGPWMLVETPCEKIVSSWHICIGDREIPIHPYKRVWSEDRMQSGLVIDRQHMADALLLAAAPELLAALIAAVECGIVPKSSASDGGASKYAKQTHVADQIRAAIAKATGGQ